MKTEKKINASIYVCHHKNSYVFSDSVYLPIQVGRDISEWVLPMLGDNSGKNISSKNRQYCELTALYWAWKNDTKSEWLGLMHYRRFLGFSVKEENVDVHGCINFHSIDESLIESAGLTANAFSELITANPDINAILPKKWSVRNADSKNLLEHYKNAPGHYEKDLLLTREVLKDLYPEQLEIFDSTMQQSDGYFTNIFVLKRELFERYCEWLFRILGEIESRSNLTNYSLVAQRIYGYISERLFNVFLNTMDKHTLIYKELPRVFILYPDENTSFISPEAPPSNAVSIVISSDDNFVPHLAALIESIKATLSKENFFDLIILDGGISKINRNLLKKQFNMHSIHSGRMIFVNCSLIFSDIDTHMHFTTNTFFRLEIGDILKNHKKAIYIDCDTIVVSDLVDLWHLDLEEKVIGAAPDVIMKNFVNCGTPSLKEAGGKPAGIYLREYVGLGNDFDGYFQAGVIIFDLDKYRKLNIAQAAIDDLKSKKYWFLDQDILNKYLKGQVCYIDTSWNCVNVSGDILNGLTSNWSQKVIEDLDNPKIVHYAGYEAKPWNNLMAPWSELYWNYLRKTFWYEQVKNKIVPERTVESSLDRGFFYKLFRYIWRSLPNRIQYFASGYSHRFVSLYGKLNR